MLWTITIFFQKAETKRVAVLMDAEQTYLQEAIDVITLDLMRMLNKKRAVVHNTYQCYLKVLCRFTYMYVITQW